MDTNSLEKNIEQTRAQLAESVDALAAKINPKAVAEGAKQSVKEAVGQVKADPVSTAKGLFDTRQKKICAAVIVGVVVAVVILGRRRRRR